MPGSTSSKTAATPSSARDGTKSFLTLPLEIRNQIYKHLFTISHPIYIFQDSPNSCNIESFMPEMSQRRHCWTGLLYVNRQISLEARAILYGVNQFHLMEVDIKQPEAQTPSLLRSFLDCIGSVNAGLLSCLCMNFPALEEERIEEDSDGGRQPKKRWIRIRQDGLQKLQLLRTQCTGLRVLNMVYTGSGLVNAEADLQGVLQDINFYFRDISSLTTIIVRVIDRSLNPSLRLWDMMRNLGWIVLFGER